MQTLLINKSDSLLSTQNLNLLCFPFFPIPTTMSRHVGGLYHEAWSIVNCLFYFFDEHNPLSILILVHE